MKSEEVLGFRQCSVYVALSLWFSANLLSAAVRTNAMQDALETEFNRYFMKVKFKSPFCRVLSRCNVSSRCGEYNAERKHCKKGRKHFCSCQSACVSLEAINIITHRCFGVTSGAAV